MLQVILWWTLFDPVILPSSCSPSPAVPVVSMPVKLVSFHTFPPTDCQDDDIILISGDVSCYICHWIWFCAVTGCFCCSFGGWGAIYIYLSGGCFCSSFRGGAIYNCLSGGAGSIVLLGGLFTFIFQGAIYVALSGGYFCCSFWGCFCLSFRGLFMLIFLGVVSVAILWVISVAILGGYFYCHFHRNHFMGAKRPHQ